MAQEKKKISADYRSTFDQQLSNHQQVTDSRLIGRYTANTSEKSWKVKSCIMNNIATYSRYTYPFLTEISPGWPTVHTYPVKTVTDNASFHNRSPECRFSKTLASRLRVGGRKRMLCEGIYRISLNHFSVFVRTGEKD